LVNLSVENEGVDFTVPVLSEAGDGVERIGPDQLAVCRDLPVFVAQPPDGAHAIIGIDIDAAQRRDSLASIDVSADDADAGAVIGEFTFGRETGVMRILDHWIKKFALRFLVFEVVKAFAHTPAVVAAFHNEVNFLPFILAHVTSPEVARLAVEAHPPNIAQPVGPYLGA